MQRHRRRWQRGGKARVSVRQSRRPEAAGAEQSAAGKAVRYLASQLSSSGVVRQEEGWRRREMTRETGELRIKDKVCQESGSSTCKPRSLNQRVVKSSVSRVLAPRLLTQAEAKG